MSNKKKPFKYDEFRGLMEIKDWDDSELLKLIQEYPVIRTAFSHMADWMRWREFGLIDRASLTSEDNIAKLRGQREMLAECQRQLLTYAEQGAKNARRNSK